MRLPQFTAEVGLRKSSEFYNGTTISASGAAGVVPAVSECVRECYGDAAELRYDCIVECAGNRLCEYICMNRVAVYLARCKAQCQGQ
jgi:hypothetical protein